MLMKTGWIVSLALLGMVTFAVGCTGGGDATVSDAPPEAAPVADDHGSDGHDHEGEGGHSLHGWWCTKHGVPEEECALCQTDLIAEFKEKGDWCEEHNRPDSQCFKCDPSRFDAFAARYEAKFGEQPPKPTQ